MMDQSKFRILIVEDEILIADNIERYLTKKGYEVVGIAISYEEAEELFIKEKPDLVLLDIKLSGPRSGIDFAHFINQQEHIIPFIFLTSQMDSRNINKAKETYPKGYLSKPIRKESLFATIEIVMHKWNEEKNDHSNIRLFNGYEHVLTPIQDILYIEAEHVYVKVHLASGDQILQRSSFKDLLDQLPCGLFLQSHRSYAINSKLITRWDTQNIYVDKTAIPISRTRRKEFFAQLGQ
jgi:DNA-binding LytR/AlgR family response regulator